MHEYTSILLSEILDCLGLGIELHGTRHGGREFLVGEIDTCKLGIEGACAEGAQERGVRVVFVEGEERSR